MNIRSFLSTVAIAGLVTAAAHSANAQATRTWVSGVGDDANPCSRTAPCKTFAGAISKTASGGEINVLDPGGFGGVTITKPITISSENFEAGVLVSGTNAIIVNVPNAADFVVLRGLDIEGLGTGINGITVLTGGTVHVEKCTVNRFSNNGINFVTTVANCKLAMTDTIVRNNGNFATSAGGGIFIGPTNSAKADLNRVRMFNNVFGLKSQGNSNTSATECIAGNNAFAGFSTAGSPAAMVIEHSVSAHNGTGIVCAAGTNVLLGNNSITGNTSPAASAGTLSTFKNNDIDAIVAMTPVNPQ
jgi:hypothetical protein